MFFFFLRLSILKQRATLFLRVYHRLKMSKSLVKAKSSLHATFLSDRTPQKNSSLFSLKPLKPQKLLDYINKTYQLARSENYERFLNEFGVSEKVRDAAMKIQSTVILQRQGDTFFLKTKYSELPTHILKFKVGEKITKERPNGSLITSVFSIEKNKLILKHDINGKEIKITRKFDDKHMKVTMEMNGITCWRYYNIDSSRHSIETETSRRESLFQMTEEEEMTASTTDTLVESVGESDIGSDSPCF